MERQAARRSGSTSSDTDWRCALCKREIKIGEPIGLMLVRVAAPEETRPVRTHHACQIDTIVGEVVAGVVDTVESGREAPRLYAEGERPGDLRAILFRLVDDFLGG